MEDSIITLEGSLLLAINAKAPRNEGKNVLPMLRGTLMEEVKPSTISLRYFPLEMAFQCLAKDQRKSVLSKEECFQATFNFTRESFEAALKYLQAYLPL